MNQTTYSKKVILLQKQLYTCTVSTITKIIMILMCTVSSSLAHKIFFKSCPAQSYVCKAASWRKGCSAFTPCCNQFSTKNIAYGEKIRSNSNGKKLEAPFSRNLIFYNKNNYNSPCYSQNNVESDQIDQPITISECNVNENNWRLHPSLTESVRIPTIFVQNDSLQRIIKELSPYLATRMKEFEDVHPRLKAIQDPDTVGISNNELLDRIKNMKAILLDADSVSDTVIHIDEDYILKTATHESSDARVHALKQTFPKLSQKDIETLIDASAFPGPIVTKMIPYEKQPIQRILSKVLPNEAQPPPTGFEQIGHVIHLNLKEKHIPFGKLIGSVILDRLSPKIQTVVNKVGEVSGPYRTYDMEILAGKDETSVEVVEDGVSLHFDLSKVYWCTRLSGERSRLLQEEFKESQIIADAFCGVGALCVLAASKLGCTIYANDLNPDAVKALKESAKKNRNRLRIEGSKDNDQSSKNSSNMPSIHVQCGDAFDFIQNLGSLPNLPHHVVMNYPLDSASFLGAFRWWSASDDRLDSCPTTVHLYTFARGDDPTSDQGKDVVNPRSAVDVAIDLVANGLIHEGGAIEESHFRKAYLDELGCQVKAYEVRDVAPGKVVICVSFKITRKLLSIMQGDFIDID